MVRFGKLKEKTKMIFFSLEFSRYRPTIKEMFDQDECALQQIDQDSFSHLWTDLNFYRDIEKFLKGYGRIRNISVKVSISSKATAWPIIDHVSGRIWVCRV